MSTPPQSDEVEALMTAPEYGDGKLGLELARKLESQLASVRAELGEARERVDELEGAAKVVLFHFMPAHIDSVSGTDCGTKLDAAIRSAVIAAAGGW